MSIIIQLSFAIELALLQFVLYSILYPTRHKKIVEERRKILCAGSMIALGAGALSCFAGGNFTFFKLQQSPLLSEALTWFLLYMVILFATVSMLSKVFQWTSYDNGDWFRINGEDLNMSVDFSPIASVPINEEGNKQIGYWKTYKIIFETSTHKEDMLAHLVQRDKDTFLCDKVILLGQPDKIERFLSSICIIARIAFFISIMQINHGLILNAPGHVRYGTNVAFQSGMCLISAWVLLRSHKTEIDVFGKIIKYVMAAVLLISTPLLVIFIIDDLMQFVL